MLNVKSLNVNTHFIVYDLTRTGIEPGPCVSVADVPSLDHISLKHHQSLTALNVQTKPESFWLLNQLQLEHILI